jgi:hypothetical protein
MGENPANYGLSVLVVVAVCRLREAATLERISRKSPANFPDISGDFSWRQISNGTEW